MKQVSKDEFFKIVGPLDVTVSVLGNYPYTNEFKTRRHKLIGKAVDRYVNGNRGLITTDYFVNKPV